MTKRTTIRKAIKKVLKDKELLLFNTSQNKNSAMPGMSSHEILKLWKANNK